MRKRNSVYFRFHRTPLLNESAAKSEPVYEYRSGTLILGTLDDVGNFTPAVGAPIVRFADYTNERAARRIYNLPGTFVPLARGDRPY